MRGFAAFGRSRCATLTLPSPLGRERRTPLGRSGGISRRRRRIRLRVTGRRNGCRTWARLAWLANETCPHSLRARGWSTCLSRDRQCQNKEVPSDRASRITTVRANDPEDRAAAAGKIFRRAQDSGSPLPRLPATHPPAPQNSEASAYSACT